MSAWVIGSLIAMLVGVILLVLGGRKMYTNVSSMLTEKSRDAWDMDNMQGVFQRHLVSVALLASGVFSFVAGFITLLVKG